MKRMVMAALLLAGLGIQVQAAPKIDPAQLEYDQAWDALITKGITNCPNKAFKTIGDRDKCRQKYFDEADSKYPRRGTKAYSEKNYAGMSEAQAEQKLIELKKIWDGATMFSKVPGEISRDNLEAEGWWIQKNIFHARLHMSDPWFIQCKKQPYKATVDLCPLGSGGK